MQEVAEAIESISSEHRVLQKAEPKHTSMLSSYLGIWILKNIPRIPVNVLQAAFGGCLFGLQKKVVFSNEKRGHLGSR